ncbi:FxDxF family PEP-CTERM protein [Roseateles sp.]|uniref:FxDxF family PEP-CTERM protein n=1 Tax=Roseateles sp. TaxID=1971397 RepID=UPI002DF74F28|nr:FxDxF family PEP-CTERM protein [Roseateles sp.]
MKLKFVPVVAALSFAAAAAQASTVNLGTLGSTITTTGGAATSFGAIVNDNFTFSVSMASTVESNASVVFGNLNPAFYGIYTAGLDSIVGNADDVLVVGHGFSAVSTSHFDILAAGNYYFKVLALSNAPVSAYALAAKAVAQPVPEPETYALLGAGLGIIGFVARRRRAD